MQGRVLFDNDLAPPMVQVVPTVTNVRPTVAGPGTAVTIFGSGFSHVRRNNLVALPGGRGCAITDANQNYLVCKVGGPSNAAAAAAAVDATQVDVSHVSGFQLAIAPVAGKGSGCDVFGSGLEGFAEARDCIAALASQNREIVTISNELLWPVLHPLRAADGAFRTEEFVVRQLQPYLDRVSTSVLDLMPPHARRAMRSTWCPC